jgi:hypothetical protein
VCSSGVPHVRIQALSISLPLVSAASELHVLYLRALHLLPVLCCTLVAHELFGVWGATLPNNRQHATKQLNTLSIIYFSFASPSCTTTMYQKERQKSNKKSVLPLHLDPASHVEIVFS